MKSLNPNARLRLFGQELEDETYAVCMADMLIRGQDPADIALGDTLSDDKHPDQRFDYQLSNPPYGVEWKPAQDAVEREHAKGAAGRFGPGLPRISDGQMLFQLNALSKMRPVINGEGGGKVGLVHNGSPLFTGDAGGGESEIRRYVLEHDYVDAIVALPTDIFYNTNIATYLWFMSNRKPKARKNKILLIDASGMGVLMKRNLGKKRFELSEDCQRRIVVAYHRFKPMEWKDDKAIDGRVRSLSAKLFPTSHFFYRRVLIERPLRQRFEITEAKIDELSALLREKRNHDIDGLLAAVSWIAAHGAQTYMSADALRQALLEAEEVSAKKAKRKSSKLKAKAFETARKIFGVRDKTAEIVSDEKGNALPDPELRDAEYVPFSVIGEDVNAGIQAYFNTEVKPHWPDAWINTDAKDEADGQIGVVGCEINFNREFYAYKPPRRRDEIKREIEAMEKQFLDMLKGVAEA